MKTAKKTFSCQLLVLVCVAFLLVGCSTAKVADPSGFLGDYSSLQEGAYFKQQYIALGIDFSKYRHIEVAPVNLSYLAGKTACDPADLENLATEFRKNIEDELTKAGFVVTSVPTAETLIISLALTNVEPPNAVLNAGLAAASFFAPVPLPFDQDGKTSFEGKISDAATGRSLAEFAEERTGSGDKMSLKAMTVGKYMKFTNTQAVFEGWSETIAGMLKNLTSNADPGSQTAKKNKAMAKQLIGAVV